MVLFLGWQGSWVEMDAGLNIPKSNKWLMEVPRLFNAAEQLLRGRFHPEGPLPLPAPHFEGGLSKKEEKRQAW